MPRVKNGTYAIQPASDQSSGHLTMASPELWADHLAEFLNAAPAPNNIIEPGQRTHIHSARRRVSELWASCLRASCGY
jgi:hypothetical protein